MLVATFAVLLAACRPYGPGIPVCGELEVTGSGDRGHVRLSLADGESMALRSAHLIQAQAVPDADYGLCVADPPTGWQPVMDEPVSGEVSLAFTSTSLGLRFLTVTLSESCQPDPGAEQMSGPVDDHPRSVLVHEPGPAVRVVVVAVAARHDRDAFLLAENLSQRRLGGNPVRSRYAPAGWGTVAERVTEALEDEAAVLVVDDDYQLSGLLELRLPGVSGPVEGSLATVLAELADRAPVPQLAATWWQPVDGGCLVYEIDASGPGAGTIEQDIDRAVGLFPLAELRAELAPLGYHLGPPP